MSGLSETALIMPHRARPPCVQANLNLAFKALLS